MDAYKHQVSMTENKAEVVVNIPNASEESHDPNNEVTAKSPPLHCASPEIRFIPSPNKTPESITPKTPLMEEDEDETIYKKVESSKRKRKRLKTKVLIELFVFVCILANLVASLTIDKLKRTNIWGLGLWRWCVLLMVTFCGMLVTKWFIHIVVLFLEKNFLLRKKALYLIHGLKKSVQFFIWLGLVLLTWVLLINRRVHRSELATKVLDGVTSTLFSLLIGALFWLLKTLLLKILASNFHVNAFFDRIQEAIFHQYVLQTLSGPPLMEAAGKVGGSQSVVDAVIKSGLSTISNSLHVSFFDGGTEQIDEEITNEMEATAAAYRIFSNVAGPGCNYIDEDDLLRFLIKEEVDLLLPLMAHTETGQINRKCLTDWVLKAYQERKALRYALNDTKAAVKQFNKLVTGILVVVMVIIWLLLMGFATAKVQVFLSSQLVLAAFLFGNTFKNSFEAIIFVFLMHPFDVGDRCVVDGVELLVEEMNILTTVFLKLNNEKVYYPNSVMATKPISNYYRSPDMGDSVEFTVDFLTSAKKIGALKEKIKRYLESKPQYWHPKHNLVVKEIEIANKIKMGLFVTHTINFQDFGQKNERRSELVMEVNKIFEELNISYNLLPQDSDKPLKHDVQEKIRE